MDEKKINEIIWWIPIKKVRNHIREFFNEYNLMKEIIVNKISNEFIVHKVNLHGIDMSFYDVSTSKAVKYVTNEINEGDYKYLNDIEFKEGDIVIDIGANLGMVSIFLAKKYPFLKIYSFEPIENNYKNLLRNIEINKIPDGIITAHNLAVTKDERDLELISDILNQGASRISGYENYTSLFKKEIGHSISLNNIIEKYNINNIKLLKIDCEGAEYEILYNTKKEILNNTEYLFGEFHPIPNEDSSKLIEYIQNYINKICILDAQNFKAIKTY